MNYNIKIYEPSKTSSDFRFTLGTDGIKPLFVIGLNPSTADDKKPDRTITKVMGYAERNGNDSFVMLNLYAQRTPKPAKLHSTLDTKLHTENISRISATLRNHASVSILATWGEIISVRKYFIKCLEDIIGMTKNKKIKWLKIGELTKSGHPRHASRAPYYKLTGFDIEKYLTTIK